MEQVLSFSGLVEEWGPALEAFGVATVIDLLNVQPSFLVMVGLTFSEAQQLLAVAWSVHAAGGVEAYNEILSVAEEAECKARDLLESTEATLEVRGSLGHARKHLDASRDPRAAVLALTAVERGRASCPGAEAVKSLGVVVHAVTDALIWRVQLRAPFGSRDAFLFQLEMAYAHPLDDTTKSRLLLSHYKAVSTRFPSAFLSQAKTDALRSKRGRRTTKARQSMEQTSAA